MLLHTYYSYCATFWMDNVDGILREKFTLLNFILMEKYWLLVHSKEKFVSFSFDLS